MKPPKSPNGFRTLILDDNTLKGLTGGATSGRASRYLFTGRAGRHLRPDNVTGRFNQIAVAAGVRPLGPHQIRHLIASNLLDAGFGIHEVAERLGHDPATLMRYYARVSATRRLQATNHIAYQVVTGDGVETIRERPSWTATAGRTRWTTFSWSTAARSPPRPRPTRP
ncbi:tyrosine-type recombinase/integrase [Nucisporomicrobium flavum]|uniref:tyrosine-type recombinase/integrase n=1 Tax=Nucisporomicrobium flavum TaxID=2785915 RepID=UPI0027DC30C1|nr:tyrosine-type recombinase/integrase [Nucisporomicrobium flavum]